MLTVKVASSLHRQGLLLDATGAAEQRSKDDVPAPAPAPNAQGYGDEPDSVRSTCLITVAMMDPHEHIMMERTHDLEAHALPKLRRLA